ncbi:methyltransferase domain-containing protein [Orbaceae bacterium ESL0727]|nr:methyltransferase domain-containing protein [Orbaceae bacterium ESL0727]
MQCCYHRSTIDCYNTDRSNGDCVQSKQTHRYSQSKNDSSSKNNSLSKDSSPAKDYPLKQCLSCPWLDKPYSQQLADKQAILLSTMAEFHPLKIELPMQSRETAFRNKAKMAVLGTVEKPMLGIHMAQNQQNNAELDLCDCPLYSKSMQTVLKLIRTYIRKQKLVPYNIYQRKGELKFVILTQGSEGFMLRFVLRSQRLVDKIKATFHQLQEKIHNLAVISVNIQPAHAAILEGEEELVLTTNRFLPMTLNSIPLFVQPKSFFQTNTQIAEKLYQTAHDWIAPLAIHSIWDLFCGVGGFGLHCVNQTDDKNSIALTGIEINPEAIECATKSAHLMGIQSLSFKSLDATDYLLTSDVAASSTTASSITTSSPTTQEPQHISHKSVPDLVLLNPPRRGAGVAIMHYLQRVKPNYILYSSCNLATLVSDLNQLADYQVQRVQLFDMFPHTAHMEVLTLLKKKD